jgi:integrase
MHGNIGNNTRTNAAATVRSAMAATTAGRYRAGPNLYKQIAASGAGSWVLRYEMRGKKRWMGLGPLAVFSLKEAMARAREAQQQIYSGIDPIDQRRQTRASEARKAILTVDFATAVQSYFDQHQQKWGLKGRVEFLNTLSHYVYPTFGQIAVADIDTALVLRAIEPIWLTKNATANRVRGRIEAVLDWCKVRGYRPAGSDNPAAWKGHLDQLLPVGRTIGAVIHHAAMPYADVPAFVMALRQRRTLGGLTGIEPLALEFLILSASRTAEVLKARWSEVDFATKIWDRPASHMKAGIAHSVPLSGRMIEILEGLPRDNRDGGDGLIFEGSKPGHPLGRNALSKVANVMNADCTVHGFRSSFRDWVGEQTSFPRELAEHALAHSVGSQVEQAYARSKLLEKRRALMLQWERFVASNAGRLGIRKRHAD